MEQQDTTEAAETRAGTVARSAPASASLRRTGPFSLA